MKHTAAGWFVAEFGVAFVAGVIGAMVAAHRRGTPAGGTHPGIEASRRVAARQLEPAS